jgi:fructose-1,6-bisphosphatase/sedoheptulose 1,7-bisphosphatase-like protein
MGIGGAPEGVITAAAMKCLNGEIQARLVFDPDRLGVDKDKVPAKEEVLDRLARWASEIPTRFTTPTISRRERRSFSRPLA